MKYAMVAINFKQNENNEYLVRRVLIRYKKYKNNKFSGTRFIEKDNYFYDTKSSHQYKFEDEGYILLDGSDLLVDLTLKGLKRDYHYNKGAAKFLNIEKIISPILFKTKTDNRAIEIFKSRNELR